MVMTEKERAAIAEVIELASAVIKAKAEQKNGTGTDLERRPMQS